MKVTVEVPIGYEVKLVKKRDTNDHDCGWGGKTRKGPCRKPAVADVLAPGLDSIPTCQHHLVTAMKMKWHVEVRK